MDIGRSLFEIFLMFLAAKVVGEVFHRLRQPAVVGEIIVGIAIGPYALGWITHPNQLLAELGVIFLLFSVGLQTRVSDLLRVGAMATWVAMLGVAVPFGLGVALMKGRGADLPVALFMGTAMVATSVGITARVLADLHKTELTSSRVILGAAVIDDILGLIVLAIVTGIAHRSLSALTIMLIVAQALAFTAFVAWVGAHMARRFSVHLDKLRLRNPGLVVSVVFCLGLSAAASYIGLAAIIGAFLAGMVFAETREEYQLHEKVEPIYDLFVPLFFVITGTHVNLPALIEPQVLWLGIWVTLLAIVGKLVGCGLAAWGLGKRDALIVGIGMAPRGEVGIVVALVGLQQKVITPDLYAVVVLMSVVTTLIAPPLLRWMLARRER